MNKHWLLHPAAKPVVFVVCLMPAFWLTYAALADVLGPNPAEALIRSTGDWALRALCLVLCITPLRVITKTSGWARFRRMVGLFVCFYAVLHAASYAIFDMGLDFAEIALDVWERPFILVGLLGLLLLLVLAFTSVNRVIKWMGGKRWQLLHRSVYIIALLAILHFFWMRAGKNNFTEVLVYASVIACLLGWRVHQAWLKRGGRSA